MILQIELPPSPIPDRKTPECFELFFPLEPITCVKINKGKLYFILEIEKNNATKKVKRTFYCTRKGKQTNFPVKVVHIASVPEFNIEIYEQFE